MSDLKRDNSFLIAPTPNKIHFNAWIVH